MLDFLDLNLKTEEIGINWKTDSLDNGDHLNYSGADKVTRYLGNYLTQNYTFPDHRGEKTYRTWDKEYKIYEQKAVREMKVIRKAG